MTYRGAELIGWARKKAAEFLTKEAGAPWMVESLEVLVAESYLRGAIDALAEETELKKLDRAAAVSSVEQALPPPGAIWDEEGKRWKS